jgi:hypothetical protein
MEGEHTSTSTRVVHVAVGLTVIVLSYSATLLAVRYFIVHLLAPVTWL